MTTEKKDSEKIIKGLQLHIEKLTRDYIALKLNSLDKKELIKEFNEFLLALGSLLVIEKTDSNFLCHFLDETWKYMKVSEQDDELPE